MTFIIRRSGKEVGKSESKVVSFSTPSEFKIGDIVPDATYTALNRNSFGDSPEVNVPSFEITNSDKPADIIASKITVTPGRNTAIIKDGTDRLTSTEDVLTAYDPDGKLVATSEGKTPEVQLKDLASSTTYQGYTIKWSNSHGSSSPALVPDFTTTSEPLEPISTDKLTMDVGITTNKIQYLGTEDRSGQIFHVAKSINEIGQTANAAPWEVTLADLDVNTKYPAGTWVVYFSKASAKTDPVPLPEFTTLDVPSPVAPKGGDISVSNVEQTTATVTDANSGSVDRSAEQIRVFLDTDAKEWTGKTGELTISLDGLTANTSYNGRLTVGYYNPTTKKTSDKVSVPNFSTKDYPNPMDPVASDLTVSDITDTTAKVTDANSHGYDRTNEQIRVSKSGSTDDFRGVNGEFSITLDPLTPNTKYETDLWFHWYNPATGKASVNVAVPTFTTKESTQPTKPADPDPDNFNSNKYYTIGTNDIDYHAATYYKIDNLNSRKGQELNIYRNDKVVSTIPVPSSGTGNMAVPLPLDITTQTAGVKVPDGYYQLAFYDPTTEQSSNKFDIPGWTIVPLLQTNQFAFDSDVRFSQAMIKAESGENMFPISGYNLDGSLWVVKQWGDADIEIVVLDSSNNILDLPTYPVSWQVNETGTSTYMPLFVPATAGQAFTAREYKFTARVSGETETAITYRYSVARTAPKAELGIAPAANDLTITANEDGTYTLTDKNTAGIDRTGQYLTYTTPGKNIYDARAYTSPTDAGDSTSINIGKINSGYIFVTYGDTAINGTAKGMLSVGVTTQYQVKVSG